MARKILIDMEDNAMYNMHRNNVCIFRGMLENCHDILMCRDYLVTAARRMQKFRRGRYGSGINAADMMQLMKFYREMQREDFVAAYARLRILIAKSDLTRSEMAAALVPVIFTFVEEVS